MAYVSDNSISYSPDSLIKHNEQLAATTNRLVLDPMVIVLCYLVKAEIAGHHLFLKTVEASTLVKICLCEDVDSNPSLRCALCCLSFACLIKTVVEFAATEMRALFEKLDGLEVRNTQWDAISESHVVRRHDLLRAIAKFKRDVDSCCSAVRRKIAKHLGRSNFASIIGEGNPDDEHNPDIQFQANHKHRLQLAVVGRGLKDLNDMIKLYIENIDPTMMQRDSKGWVTLVSNLTEEEIESQAKHGKRLKNRVHLKLDLETFEGMVDDFQNDAVCVTEETLMYFGVENWWEFDCHNPEHVDAACQKVFSEDMMLPAYSLANS